MITQVETIHFKKNVKKPVIDMLCGWLHQSKMLNNVYFADGRWHVEIVSNDDGATKRLAMMLLSKNLTEAINNS